MAKTVSGRSSGAEVLRAYHEATKLSLGADNEPVPAPTSPLVQDFRSMDPENRPDPFKRYSNAERLALPTDVPDSQPRALDVLSGRVGASSEPLDLARLARLLFFSAGVTRKVERKQSGVTSYMRVAPAAGNLHPIEIYAVSGTLPGLEAGVYHFAPLDFALERLRPADFRASLASTLGDTSLTDSPLFLVLTGIPFRTGWKYAERGYRHLYWDAGTMLANLLAMVEASGWSASLHLAFVDAHLSHLLGLDGVAEFPLAVVRLAGHAAAPGAPGSVSPPTLETTAIAPSPIEFPLVTEAQRAGDLPDQDAVTVWRNAAAVLGSRVAGPSIDLPSLADGDSLEAVILRRGSTRLMRRQEAPSDLLTWAMAAATQPLDSDFMAPGMSLLDHFLAVHRVEGITPGFYRWQGSALTPIRNAEEESVRRTSAHLCLDQPLGGDSAYTVFHCTDLAALLPAAGARGYRAAQLESGIVAGRLGLAAFTLGFGATELTFLDDEVSQLFGADCMLVTSVGVPDYANKTGGRPGRPADLTGWESLMSRFTARFEEGT